MTKDEKKLKMMLIRTFKLKLASVLTVSGKYLTNKGKPRKFSQLEIDTMGCYLDKEEEGLIRISDLENACQFPPTYEPFHAEVVEVKEELEESILNVLDLFRPLNLIFKMNNQNPDQVFTLYDKNKSYLLSRTEIAAICKHYLGLDNDLLKTELNMIQEYFKQQLKRSEIKKQDFADFIKYDGSDGA